MIGLATSAGGFNPRICKRCDSYQAQEGSQNYVSIHASVKDATLLEFDIVLFVHVSIHASVKDATFGRWYWWRISFVSIHASVKDATSCWSLKTAASRCFNPRICKRCDYAGHHHIFGPVVSIHASVKDATYLNV